MLVCLCIHESGHAIAGALTGGTIDEIAVLTLRPHVRISGNAGPAAEMFRAAAGSLLAAALCFTFSLLRRPSGPAAELVRTVAALFTFIELAGWILSSLFPDAQTVTDANRFIAVSGIRPEVVAGVCASIGFAAMVILCTVSRSSRRQRPVDVPEIAKPLAARSATAR